MLIFLIDTFISGETYRNSNNQQHLQLAIDMGRNFGIFQSAAWNCEHKELYSVVLLFLTLLFPADVSGIFQFHFPLWWMQLCTSHRNIWVKVCSFCFYFMKRMRHMLWLSKSTTSIEHGLFRLMHIHSVVSHSCGSLSASSICTNYYQLFTYRSLHHRLHSHFNY